jgi:hypothetical protein
MTNNFNADTGISFQMRKSLQWNFSFGIDMIKPKVNLYSEFGIAFNSN